MPTRYYSVDSATGAAGQKGLTGLSRLIDVEHLASGRFVASDGAALFEMHPAGGQATMIGFHGFDILEGDLAEHPTDGRLFAITGANSIFGRVFTISQSSGAATLIGETGLRERDFSGLAFDRNGLLYTIESSQVATPSLTYHLARVDPSTGAAVEVLTFPSFVRPSDPGVAGFDIDWETNVGYFTTGERLFTVNMDTFAVADIGALGLEGRMSGLAVIVPEPIAHALLCAITLGCIASRRTP